MNRIVLIGNGFDLAHGLKTSYADFIDWYWEQWKNKVLSSFKNRIDDGLCSVEVCRHSTQGFWAYFNFEVNIGENKELSGYDFINFTATFLNFKVKECDFLTAIMHDVTHYNWVDIERIYYRLLCDSLKENSEVTPSELNHQLAVLTEKLQEYLNEIQNKAIREFEKKKGIQMKIFEPIKLQDISIKALADIKKYFQERCGSTHLLDLLEDYQDLGLHKQWGLEVLRINFETDHSIYMERDDQYNFKTLPENILMVNFNYTAIADLYIPNNYQKLITSNHIHGSLANLPSIIFGYGDEMDKHYKELEEYHNNEYLNNVKSIKYLESKKYRELLDFVESAPYQIYIMGHSCGNSDRTLLNTLFEHKNCVSIKPFYYVKDNGEDNYTELVQNISRNFKNKQALRDKVVNKEYCETLI